MKLKPYFLPAIITAALFVAAVCIPEWAMKARRAQAPKAEPDQPEVCLGFPWADPKFEGERIMNVVVEESGVYVGELRIPFDAFRSYLIHHARDWRPDSVSIHGTIGCRYGRSVQVLDTLRLLRLFPFLGTRVLPVGTRLPEIEIWTEEELHNLPAAAPAESPVPNPS